ncbi:Ribosomal RNA adenine dimethylase domain protein [Rhodopirellula islandica]|uniref:Ribosomal RNA adenine dimethylase domain protein n=1 Tax=Rhodopirellula islandica TaxID=595434 RepID=A0A0J1EIA6_RHOIS|nr:rRNA adenine N-6-methyltransferase family protein [Rhodopirellula islandica]KLU05254.1 Ribosomal RNA adenine dimethylase domain protein [Rhodopirellula islandica]
MHAITAGADVASTGPTFMKRAYYVLKAWSQAPLDVATLCPSSPSLTRKLANRDCVKNARNVIELGPGAGGTTQTLLEFMRPDARLMVVEKSTVFSKPLQAIHDPRLEVVMGDACALTDLVMKHEFGLADVVVSGIPFSSMPPTIAKTIAQSIHQVLRPGGVFIAYQIRDHVNEFARPLFGPAETEAVPMNLPPLTLYTWTKVCMPKSNVKNNGAIKRSVSP